MITLTPEAAQLIRESAKQTSMQGMPLRVAVTLTPTGEFHYALGFDDTNREGDNLFTTEGIDVVVAPQSMEQLNGTVIDYVDIEGKKEVIFINPNDPAQKDNTPG